MQCCFALWKLQILLELNSNNDSLTNKDGISKHIFLSQFSL